MYRLPRRPAPVAAGFAVVAAAVLVARTDPRKPVTPPEPAELDPDAGLSPPEVRRCAVRVAARKIVARDVIAGRTSVAEAAAVFAALNELPPRSPFYPGPAGLGDGRSPSGEFDDRLMLGLQVVRWVAVVAGEEMPERAGELVRAVEAEVRGGGVRELPAVGGAAYAKLLAAADAEVAARYRPPEFVACLPAAEPAGPARVVTP